MPFPEGVPEAVATRQTENDSRPRRDIEYDA
jgi:hypothetical protein